MLDLDTKQVPVSRDVQFVKNVFPFQQLDSTPPQLLFPSSNEFTIDDLLNISRNLLDPDDSSGSYSVTRPLFNSLDIVDTLATSHGSDSSLSTTSVPMNTSIPSTVVPIHDNVSSAVISSSRPQRSRQLPAKLQDYTGLPTHLVNTVFYTTIESIPEPQTFKEAVGIMEWCEAMNIELAAQEANQTWDNQTRKQWLQVLV